MKRARVGRLLSSMAFSSLLLETSAKPSRPMICSKVSLYRSAGEPISFSSTSCSMVLSPRPSISMARRETKWMIACLSCAWQLRRPTQRYTEPSLTDSLPLLRLTSCVRSTAEPHTGHCSGMCTGRAFSGRRSGTTAITCGITSPARRMITVSPIITPRRATSSMLCRVALATITPATLTGFRRATGVTAPVRPT